VIDTIQGRKTNYLTR